MKNLIWIVAISLVTLSVLRQLLPADFRFYLGKREFVAAALLPAIGTFSPNYLAFAVFLTALIALVPASSDERLRLAVFSLPLLPLCSLYVDAPAPINQLIRVDSGMLMLLACAPVAVIYSLRRGVKFGRWDVLMLLLMAVFVFMAGRGTSFTNISRETVEALLVFGLPYLLISRNATPPDRPRKLLFALVFAAVVIAAIAAFESIRNWLLYSTMNVGQDALDISGYTKQRGGFLRAQATFPEPTSLSLFLALATVILFGLRRHVRGRAAQVFLFGVLASGLTLTFARIGPLVLLVGIIAVLIFERRNAVAAALVCIGPGAWMILKLAGHAVPAIAALTGTSEGAAGTIDYRQTVNERMLEVVHQHPLLGISQGQVAILLADLKQGEGIIDLLNAPLAIAMQAGLIGVVIFLLPIVASLAALWRLRKRKVDDRAPAAATFAALLGLNVGLLTTSLNTRNALWLMLLLGLSAAIAAKNAATRPVARTERHRISGSRAEVPAR